MTAQKTSAPDWRVGDGIINGDDGHLMVAEQKSGDCWFCVYSGLNKRVLIRKNGVENFHNIDATIRAKNAEIEALKVQLERSNKIDEANHAFTMSLEQQLYNDPWCYDLDKAPSNQVVLVCFDLSPLLTPVYSLQTVIIRNGNLIDSYTGNSLSELRFIAWILIPEPKGETV